MLVALGQTTWTASCLTRCPSSGPHLQRPAALLELSSLQRLCAIMGSLPWAHWSVAPSVSWAAGNSILGDSICRGAYDISGLRCLLKKIVTQTFQAPATTKETQEPRLLSSVSLLVAAVPAGGMAFRHRCKGWVLICHLGPLRHGERCFAEFSTKIARPG